MKKKEPNKKYDHVRRELTKEKKIALFQIILIVVLFTLGTLLAVFSDDDAMLAVWVREFFKGQ